MDTVKVEYRKTINISAKNIKQGTRYYSDNPLVDQIWLTGSFGIESKISEAHIHVLLKDETRKSFYVPVERDCNEEDVYRKLFQQADDYIESVTNTQPIK